MKNSMIELKSVSRSFHVGDQTVHALDNVTLAIPAGDYVSIMGPSGSGKSTLLNIIGLLDRPTQGQYVLDNKDVSTLTDEEQATTRSNKIGFVFQAFHLVSRLTAFENIELPMVLAGVEPEERKTKVEKILEELGIADRSHHKPKQLSGGQRQRVAIARATIMHPNVLLADEPTGNLDRASGAEIVEVLESLNKQGITLIVVTHDPLVAQRAKRTITLSDGLVVGAGLGLA